MRPTPIATHSSTHWLDLAIESRSFDQPAIAPVSALELVAIPEATPVEATPVAATRERPGFFNRRTGALAGAAIALVGGTSLVQLANQPAQYEGKFQLLVEPTVAPASAATQASVQAARSAPTIDYASQIHVLWSYKLLSPVAQQLETQYADITYKTLAEKLEITHQASEKTLEITYQDTDPQKVQAVLETVSRAYLEYSQACRTHLCKQLQFVEQRLPHIQQQVTIAQQKLQTLQQQHGVAEVLGQQLSQRSGVLAQQRQDLQIRLIEARTQVAIRQKRLAPADARLVEQSLAQNNRYQSLRQQLQTIADQLAVELARPQSTGATLQPLKQRYQVLTAQMTQAAQAPIGRQLAQTIAAFQAKKTTDYTAIERQQTLLEGVTAATQVQVLTLTEAAIAQTEKNVQRQIQQWAVFARQSAALNLELKFATDNLNLYQAKRAELQQIIAPKPDWQLTSTPKVEPLSSLTLSDPEQRFSLGLLLSFLLVLLVMSIADQTRQTKLTQRRLQTTQPEYSWQNAPQPTASEQIAAAEQAATLFLPAVTTLTERSTQHQRTTLFLLTAAVRLEPTKRTKLAA